MQNILLSALNIACYSAIVYFMLKLVLKCMDSVHQKEIYLQQEKFDVHNEKMRFHRMNLEKDIEILVSPFYTPDEKALVTRIHLERIEREQDLNNILKGKK